MPNATICHLPVPNPIWLKEYYSIFSVAYKLIVGFAAVGIINGVFMHLEWLM